MDNKILDRCRKRLIEIARGSGYITYGELAKHLGVASRGLGPYLNEIYDEESARNAPDLTVVVVYAGTTYGRFRLEDGNTLDPDNAAHRAEYDEELASVREHWAMQSASTKHN